MHLGHAGTHHTASVQAVSHAGLVVFFASNYVRRIDVNEVAFVLLSDQVLLI